MSAGTIRNILAPVRAMLADAAEDGLIRSNPASGVRVPATAKPADQRPKTLSEREVKLLLAAVPDEHRLLIQVIAETGVRVSEAIGWRWSDFDGQRLHVRRRLYLGEADKPKSAYGVRAIPLRSATAKALWLHRKATSYNGDDDPIFASGTGGALDYGNLYHRVLKPAMLAAGIEHGGFHRLRHTAATRLIERGARPDQAQRWLGHHDIGFTLRTYVHADADDLPDPDDVWGDGDAPGDEAADEAVAVAG